MPKTVLLLCKAVQMSLSPLKGDGAIACLSHCDRASSYLRSSISVPLTQSGNWLDKVQRTHLLLLLSGTRGKKITVHVSNQITPLKKSVHAQVVVVVVRGGGGRGCVCVCTVWVAGGGCGAL